MHCQAQKKVGSAGSQSARYGSLLLNNPLDHKYWLNKEEYYCRHARIFSPVEETEFNHCLHWCYTARLDKMAID